MHYGLPRRTFPAREHVRHSVPAGLEMNEVLHDLRPCFRVRNGTGIHVGVGVNSGGMAVGISGSETRVAYMLMGDAVNLASLLGSNTGYCGAPRIVGETPRSMISDQVFRELDKVMVKGKNKFVSIFEPIGLQKDIDSSRFDEYALWEHILHSYLSQVWNIVESLLRLQKTEPSRPLYKAFIQRFAAYRRNPPGAKWNGAYCVEAK